MPDPTPQQITELTAQIRTGWTEREHYIRAGKPIPFRLRAAHDQKSSHGSHYEIDRWTPPVVSLPAVEL